MYPQYFIKVVDMAGFELYTGTVNRVPNIGESLTWVTSPIEMFTVKTIGTVIGREEKESFCIIGVTRATL